MEVSLENWAKRIPWLRVLVEGLVIVGSILLALAADAWWDSVQDGREEKQVLSDLRDEFLDDRSELDRQISRTKEKRAAAEELLEWMSAARDLSVPRLDSLWAEMVTTTGFDPATGVYDATIASGRLELVRSREFRNSIAGWPHLANEVLVSEGGVRQVVLESLVPALAEGGAPLSGALAETGYEWRAPRPTETEAEAAYASLRTDATVKSLLAYRYSWTTGLLGDYTMAEDFVESVIELIEAELER